MSRSKPNLTNPCTRWMEWKAKDGNLQFYDKELESNVPVELPFRFFLLDTLATIKGWSDSSNSAIYSNEVRSTKTQPLTVRSFKGGVIASGVYQDIKDRVSREGGRFTQNCYIAFFDDDGELVLGSLQVKGAALNAWIEFMGAHRSEAFEKSVVISGSTEGKKGAVTFKVPNFEIANVTPEENRLAVKLDETLQSYLSSYEKNESIPQEEPVANDEDDDEIPF